MTATPFIIRNSRILTVLIKSRLSDKSIILHVVVPLGASRRRWYWNPAPNYQGCLNNPRKTGSNQSLLNFDGFCFSLIKQKLFTDNSNPQKNSSGILLMKFQRNPYLEMINSVLHTSLLGIGLIKRVIHL